MHKLARFFVLALFLLTSTLASAAGKFSSTISPPGGKTEWDLYVYGNARVVYDVIMGITGLISPDIGTSGYQTLMLLLATLGFLSLAIAAGFDPGKNFVKMFTYIFVTWFISFTTVSLKANVVINDLAGADTGVYVIKKAPALVVMPAVLTGFIGKYMTAALEQNLSMPGADTFKLSGQAVGQYNLFGKMLQESTQYVITNPQLKKSVAQYIGDCAIPAMALGKLQGTGKDGSKQTGTAALLDSTNLWGTLGSASNASLLTKYFPYDVNDVKWANLAGSETHGIEPDPLAAGGDNSAYMGVGILMSCESSYKVLTADLNNYAQAMVDGTDAAWAAAGVHVTFQAAQKAMLQSTGFSDTASSPSANILQTAMINSMHGSFRQAAAQTGNNEMLNSVQIAQAEASQWSAWSAGFSTFSNTMGYVFTVLQVFILALTPLIILAMTIPGMGSKIFVNYAQILIWLTLWMPMLAIINFLIVEYAAQSTSIVVGGDAGPNMASHGLLAQSINHSMIAAQFLGTMVPMIAWGIVKGAMAFTEFINHGIGNQFASQAGAAAATGNMSLNNSSMDNLSMNKFSTMASSQVGSQGVAVGSGTGALTNTDGLGGQALDINGSKASSKMSLSDSDAKMLQHSQSISQTAQAMNSQGVSLSTAMRDAAGHGSNSTTSEVSAHQISRVLANGIADGSSTGQNATNALAKSLAMGHSTSGGTDNSFSSSVGLGTKNFATLGIAANADGSYTSKQADGSSITYSATSGETHTSSSGVDHKTSTSLGWSKNDSNAIQHAAGSSNEMSHTVSTDSGTNWSRAVSDTYADAQQYASSTSHTIQASHSRDVAGGMGAGSLPSFNSDYGAARGTVMSDSAFNAGASGMRGGASAAGSATGAAYAAGTAANGGALKTEQSHVGSHAPNMTLGAGFTAADNSAKATIKAAGGTVAATGAALDAHGKKAQGEAQGQIDGNGAAKPFLKTGEFISNLPTGLADLTGGTPIM